MNGARCDKGVGDRSGSALVLVLVVTVVLSTLALSVGGIVRARIGAMDTQQRLLKARRDVVNIAHVALAVVAVDTNGWDAVGERWSGLPEEGVRGKPMRVKLFPPGDEEGSGSIIALRDEQSRLCVNTMDEAMLSALFEQHAGLRGRELRRAVDGVLDWVDEDDERSEYGAEAKDYDRTQAPVSCANSPFVCLEELLLVAGVTDECYQQVKGLLTVHGDGRVNLNTAPLEVLLVVAMATTRDRGAVEGALGRVVDARESGAIFERMAPEAIGGVLAQYGLFSSEEAVALSGMAGSLCVESDLFRGVAVSERGSPGRAVRYWAEFVVSRSEGGFVEWLEGAGVPAW